MKSYYQHLSSTKEFGESPDLVKKPTLRTSAIFPVIKNNHFSTSIHFLGYWLLKRNIPEVSLLISLRDSNGKILLRKTEILSTAKAFSIILNELLNEINYDTNNDFLGSIETEFNSTRDMVYPYPALVLEYHNEDFNTCVHTIGRIYNDFEDMKENNSFHVPETGFDIHQTNDLTPFISFVNGPLENLDSKIQFVITNSKSEKLNGNFDIGKINPFETKFIYLENHIPNLSEFLDGSSGSISLHHNLKGFYPRFLAGNIQESFPSISFTHSYYDCTSCTTDYDYWDRKNDTHYDSSIYVPIFHEKNQYTNLIIYPNLSPSEFSLQIQIFKNNGIKIFENQDILKIKNNHKKLSKINLNSLVENLEISADETLAAYFTTNFENNKIPTRIKFGLDVGIDNSQSNLPCNICFNMKLGNPLIENKPGSFHWAPIFTNRNYVLAIGNFSTLKEYQKSANLELSFYRIEDSSNVVHNINLEPNSEKRVSLNDFDLDSFIKTEGWVTIKADNPYVHGYYFNLNSSGSVSGDHFF